MATVHPSRMGLVPQDKNNDQPERRRAKSPSPSRRYESDRRDRDRDRDRDRGRERDKERTDYSRGRTSPRRRPEAREHSRGRVKDRERGRDGETRRDRDGETLGQRERDGDGERGGRRASPEYGEYKRPVSPAPGAPSMYPSRQPRDGMYERDRPPHARGGYGGNDFLESRRLQREGSTLSIWPPSPKAPARTLTPERGSSRRKSKRDRSETPTDTSDSDSERRRREHKERKRARREKDRKEKKERKARKHRNSRSHDASEEEERFKERDEDRRSKSKSRGRSPDPSRTPSPARTSEGEEWVEKPVPPSSSAVSQSNGTMPPPATIPIRSTKQAGSDDDSDDDIGPQPLQKAIMSKRVDERAYGGALLRGEGSAMAAFLQDDPQSRIPRRGEIGLTSDEIAQFESVGYVMSGSRHKRMNAVRMRKENQVISAEEKRGILKLQKEERERREAILREEFSELVSEKLKAPAKPK
ncbi:hypothetical protein PAXRUDRAFT_679139 [Paxillus rubicundulus Ve08.2h10]|uniref:Unplaced genomic scaffold scaffold_69, whole genome shotgun sequence n=1 Tax=Paxillus rubicundulus Ve08.2h10 TaxID=930991 RepID=A0A0D0DJD2_9AGAM|nr:hypothetical protein PAXRUDRAFT_679139 [Paxillus rubicundulus Ve08.2h10]